MVQKGCLRFDPGESWRSCAGGSRHAGMTPAYMVVDENERLVGIFTKTDLLNRRR